MTNPISTPIRVPRCGRGTCNGEAAKASRYLFAPCILAFDHPNIGVGCDSGPVEREATDVAREAA